MNNRKVLIIISKYYKDISENLLKSAVTFLEENSIIFDVIEVPGALEIPQVLNFQVNNSNNLRFVYEGYIALGCVIKGETWQAGKLHRNHCTDRRFPGRRSRASVGGCDPQTGRYLGKRPVNRRGS